MAKGDVVLVDVRPAEEFEAGHIDGAQSIPIEELKRRLDELPGDREVVAYCRGPFCAYAHEAVRTLRAEGRSARRLEDGWPEWRLSKEETPYDHETRQLDTAELEQRVKRMYEEVALEPDREFHFETGRPLAERLGYPAADLDRIPAQRSTRSPASATSSTSPRSSPARWCSTSAAAPAPTASWQHSPAGRTVGWSAST